MENLLSYLMILMPFIFFIIKLFLQKNKKLPPSPFALPIIGHLHLIRQPPLYVALKRLLSRHGPILYLKFGTLRVLVLSSPSAIEDCFTKNDIVFANRPRTVAGDHLTYNHSVYVVTPYGHLWRTLRRLTVVEIFSTHSLQKSSAVREAEVRNILRRLFKASEDKTQKVNLKFLFDLLTLNINLTLLTGKSGNVDGDEETEAARLKEFKGIFTPSLMMNECDFFPVLRWIGYKGIEQKLRNLGKRRDDYMTNLIQGIRDEKRTKDGSATKYDSLIEKLFALQDQDPEFYSDVTIKSIIVMMFIAGTETTTITLEWAMSLLLNHPQELRKVRAEIDDQIGNDRFLNDSDLTKLPYLRSVVDETLRLHPTAPLLLPHWASEDCTVGGYDVPRGTILMVNAWALHRDPNVWDDPDKFIPDRFKSEEEQEGVKYLPFGVGRRACPGASMALRVVMLCLGLMIQCFEWERVGSEMVDMDQASGLAMSKKDRPLEAICKPRQDFIKLLNSIRG